MYYLKLEGVSIPEDMFNRCVDIMKKLKQEDGVWMYRTGAAQKVEGCQGRASLCEFALFLAGQGNTNSIALSAQNFFKHRNVLEAVKGRKGTHIGSGGTAPYYFLFGHYWMARAQAALAPAVRDANLAKLRDLFLKDQESDGSYTDFPMLEKYHKMYGAALGSMTLYEIGTLDKDYSKQKRR